MAGKTGAADRRQKLREEFWPREDAWTGEDEKGWFRAPRTLPLVLALLGDKQLTKGCNPAGVYLELIARQIDAGVVTIESEADHAYAAGYVGPRALRTWQERMRLLEKLGFIKVKAIGNQPFKHVLIVHPTKAIHHLQKTGKINPHWWDAYRDRQIQTKEASYQERLDAGIAAEENKVVPLKKTAS
jgi:hypothetical protein